MPWNNGPDDNANTYTASVLKTVGTTLNAAGGNDTVVAGLDSDTINGGAGDDTLVGGGGGGITANVLSLNTLLGTNLSLSSLIDDPASDTINGGDGNDEIFGENGNDNLNGDSGNDTIVGGLGVDTVDGGAGDDVIIGGGGASLVGLDVGLTDAIGLDINLLTVTDNSNDTLRGGDGNDTIYGEGGADQIFGGNDNDTLVGGAGDDALNGQAGDDRLVGGAGNDTMSGGAGNDTYAVNEAGDTVSEAGGGGTDTVETTLASYALGTDVENLTSTGTGSFTGTGNAGNNVITGNATGSNLLSGGEGNDTLTGGSGNDTLNGGGGDDRLVGGAGADTMSGGTGNDTYVVTETGDTVSEAGGGGTDTVQTTLASYALGSGVENLTFAGTGDFTGTGNAGNNVITGSTTGTNLLSGGEGNDTLTGGSGNDTLNGGDGNDTLSGGDGDDTLNGGGGDDIINAGGSGNDSIDGGTGNNSIVFGGNYGDYTIAKAETADGQSTFSLNGATTTIRNAGNFSFADTTGVTFDSLACYVTGTLIETARGPVAVEDLRVGDSLRVLSGRNGDWAPLLWVGWRDVDLLRHPSAARVAPVRIRRGALGPNMPSQDLLVSPDHCMWLDGALVPAQLLVDGEQVVQEHGHATVTYWHVELPAHDVVRANGAASESYLDTGNRSAFTNGGAVQMLHADFAGGDSPDRLVPRLPADGGAVVRVWRARIRARGALRQAA
jgi:Ca2+-binding RTX toxin-like protein